MEAYEGQPGGDEQTDLQMEGQTYGRIYGRNFSPFYRTLYPIRPLLTKGRKRGIDPREKRTENYRKDTENKDKHNQTQTKSNTKTALQFLAT